MLIQPILIKSKLFWRLGMKEYSIKKTNENISDNAIFSINNSFTSIDRSIGFSLNLAISLTPYNGMPIAEKIIKYCVKASIKRTLPKLSVDRVLVIYGNVIMGKIIFDEVSRKLLTMFFLMLIP